MAVDNLRGMRKEAQWALFRRLVELQIYVLHAWHSSISSLIYILHNGGQEQLLERKIDCYTSIRTCVSKQ